MQRLTSLWKNTDKNGKPYMRGYFQDQIILIYPNGFKKQENDPDFIAYTAEKPKKQDDANAPRQPINTNFAPNNQEAQQSANANQYRPQAQAHQPMQQSSVQQSQPIPHQVNPNDIPF